MTAPAQAAVLPAIWKVMKSVTSVAKSGQYADGGTRYKFRSIDDLLTELGAAFREHGVFVQSEQLEFQRDRDRQTKNGAIFTTIRVKMRYQFTSLEDGSTLTFEAWGEGADTSDKATMKAHTMAFKTVLGQAFMLPTDEKDPDSTRPGDDYSEPIGRGYDPNQAARDRAAKQREQAAATGVTPPEQSGDREEKNAQWTSWVQREFQNDAMTLERLAYIHMLTKQKGLLGIMAGGVPLGQRIRAELARFGFDPNTNMPTPEQARAWMERQQGGSVTRAERAERAEPNDMTTPPDGVY